MKIRKARQSDLEQVCAIYNDAVINTTATFDTETKTSDYFLSFINKNEFFHYLCVAEENGSVIGYAGLYPFSQRKAYAGMCELTCYIHPDHQSSGVGTKLIAHVDQFIQKTSIHTVLSLFNTKNIRVEKIMGKFNFEYKGEMTEVAFKFNQYQSLNIYQKIYREIMDGTAHRIILDKLNKNPYFNQFRNNELSRKEYFQKINDKASLLLDQQFNEDMLNLSARFHFDDESFVDDILKQLVQDRVIPTAHYNKSRYTELLKKVDSNYIHGGKKTFIFPEERRFIYALTDICKPRKLAFMGSYYAYWAVWAIAALEPRAEIWLMDIDPDCQSLAKKNIDQLCLSPDITVHYETDDAIYSIKTIKNLDWVILDAEGPKSGPSDPDLIDKAIYYPMIKSAFSSLNQGGLMLAHNILLENTTDSAYIKNKILWNQKMFTKFLPFMKSIFQYFNSFESTEGIGVAKK